MFESIHNFVLANVLEFYTAVIATLGVAFWVVDRRSMKAALNAARGSEITALRLERQKTEASVERSFATLEMRCQATRDAWEAHNRRNGPMLISPSYVSTEQKEIRRILQTGRAILDQFKASAPKRDSSEIEELEVYFIAANRTSLEITRLASQLPEPTSIFH